MTPSCYTGALWDAWMVDIHSCQLVRSSDQTCIIWQHLRSFIEILLKIFSCGFSLFFFFFLNKKKVVLLFAFFIFVKQFGALLIAIYYTETYSTQYPQPPPCLNRLPGLTAHINLCCYFALVFTAETQDCFTLLPYSLLISNWREKHKKE